MRLKRKFSRVRGGVAIRGRALIFARARRWLLGSVLLGFGLAFPVSGAAQPPEEECEYLTFYVQLGNDGPHPVGHTAETRRQGMIEAAAAQLVQLGFRRVESRDMAHWRLSGFSWIDGNEFHRFRLSNSKKIAHHMFVVMLNDPEFPYRGFLGLGYHFEIVPHEAIDVSLDMARKAVLEIWADQGEQVLALCEARAELLAQGWSAVEELRLHLEEEMRRVRAERSRASSEKRLELRAEPPGTSGTEQ